MRWAGHGEKSVVWWSSRTGQDRDESIGVAPLSEPTSICGGRLSVLPKAVKPTDVPR
jgi:hypothetical protein